MGRRADERIERYFDNITGSNPRVLEGYGGTNVIYQGDVLYSYGWHFELARLLRDANGDPHGFLLNGDLFSVTTSQHQATTRTCARDTGLPTIIVPYAALNAARIDNESIEIVNARGDRFETIYHKAATVSGPFEKMDDPSGATERAHRWIWSDDGRQELREVDVPAQVDDLERRRVNERNWTVATWDPNDEVWRWETQRHWLGDSTFRARVRGDQHKTRFLSSFDHQEARPLYFLCELPAWSSASTVEEAYEDLKPRIVKDAEANGLTVSRQGDMFAVPTELTTREVKALTPYGKGRIVKRPRFGVLGTRHTASEIVFATEGRVYARGLLYHEPDQFRERDHARRKMGDGRTWHLLTRNTVPRQEARRRRQRERSTDDGQLSRL